MRYELTKADEHIRYYPESYKGWISDGKKKLVSPPSDKWTDGVYSLNLVEDEPVPEPEPEQPRMRGSFVEFMDLFTDQEQILMIGAKSQSAELEILLMRGAASNEIDLESKVLIAGIGKLVTASILTQARVDSILSEGF